MDSLDAFLQRLLFEGRVVFRGRPVVTASPPAGAMATLERAYFSHRLEVAGPPIPFDARVAVAAGELVRQAAWALINHDQRSEDLEGNLSMAHTPTAPSHHLSADLTLRFLPQIHRRSRAFDPADLLTTRLAAILRHWPLSGVLSDVEAGPASPPNLGGHPGLLLLYAERLARHEKPAWRPEGILLDYVELVRQERARGQVSAPAGGGADHGW